MYPVFYFASENLMNYKALHSMLALMLLFAQTDHNTPSGHPFDPCPDSPNCVIDSADFSIPASRLIHLADETLKKMGAYEVHTDQMKLSIDAIFRIRLFGFKDDVQIHIIENDVQGSRLFIRSASRTGYSDLGVNQRRVTKFFNQLENKIKQL
ncbi:MAG: DUF1499 domain-containing protein [Balneolaceae bacterium]|nr:MAG: DUF1499 domain-containing protein [Balneolaceae bacterium]